MLRIIVLISVLTLVGCKASKKLNPSETVIMMMEKTSCMGDCPAYKFEIFLDNTARYHGKKFVDKMGIFTATLTDAQLDNLKNSFAEADYFSFANVYSAPLTDLPTTFIYFNNGKESLKVTDYWGAPDELKKLEKQVDELISTIEWKKSN